MKNIEKILQDMGIELTEEQTKILNKEVGENYKTISDYNMQVDKLATANKTAKENEDALKEFKNELAKLDVKDMDELNQKMNNYVTSLSNQKSDYEKQIKKLEMSALLKSKADEFGCVDFELAKSQLNIDELLESKDQSNDIEKAFNALKESKPILFKEIEENPIDKSEIIGGAGEAGYAEDRDYEGYAGEAVYAEDQEYAGGTGYAPQEGYGAEAGYAAQERYGAEAGYAAREGYGAEAGYAAREGYGAEAGYAAQERYGAEAGYAAREGYDAEAGYAAQEGHGAQAGYAAQQGHGAQAGYDAQEGYGAEAGYAEDDDEEAGVYDDYGQDDGENPPVHDQVTIEPEEAVTGHQEWMPEEDPDAMTDKALKARMHEAEVQANLAMEMSRISDQGFRREVEMAQTRVLSDIRDISKSPVRQAHHLMIEAATPQQGLEQAIESLKKIHKETGAKNQAAKITGEKINGKGVFNISDKLTGKDLIIEGAGDMTESILQELNQLMARDETGMNVVLIDTAERLAGLHRIYPGLAKRFEYIGTSTPHKEDGYEASKEDKRPVRQVQVKRQDNPQPAVRTMGRPHPAQEETKTAVQEQQPRQQTAQEMIKPERRPEQQKPVAKMQPPQPDPVQKLNAADSDKVNETVPASLKKDETGPVSIKKNRTVPTSAKDETGPVSIKKNRTVPASAKDETGPVSIKKNQAVPASVKKVPEPEIHEEEEIPDDEEMDIDEFAQYACQYASDIDCSISGKSMLALYERIEIMEEDGVPLTKVNAEDLIEEAADKAENPSFIKRITGIFSSKYDRDGLLIL
mgnify:CR=1 FL=1